MHRCLQKAHGPGDDAPRHHDACDPHSRAVAVQQDVTRHFEHEIAEEENPCAQTINGLADTDVGVHSQGGKTDVVAVQKSDDEQQDQKGDQAFGHTLDGLLFDVRDIRERDSHVARPQFFIVM